MSSFDPDELKGDHKYQMTHDRDYADWHNEHQEQLSYSNKIYYPKVSVELRTHEETVVGEYGQLKMKFK